MRKLFYVFILLQFAVACSSISGIPKDGTIPVMSTTSALKTASPTSTISPTKTELSTPTPSITLIPTDTPTKTSTPIHPVGKLVPHAANNEIIYNWFSYIPKDINKDEIVYIWVTSATTMPNDDYNEITSNIEQWARQLTYFADEHKFVLLTLAIPRPLNPEHIYVIAFYRKVFLPSTSPLYQSPDLVLNRMIENLIATLRQDGYSNVSDKVFMDGYSAGAMFAQRYALLHPDRLMAIAAGQCGGSFTAPDIAYDWPIGIKDIEKLSGFKFKENEYRKLPQLIYIGEQDTNNSTVLFGNPDVFTEAQIMKLFNLFGRDDPERLQSQVEHTNKLGFTNVFFKLYPGITHVFTDRMVEDTFEFFDEYR